MNLYFASHNKNKAKEISALLDTFIQLKTLDELQCFEEIPETAKTLEGNAFIKANYISQTFGVACLADDTGLEIDALSGEPGVLSARYAGEQRNSIDNMQKVLKSLSNVNNRSAQFRTVICLILGEETHYFEGIVKGTITQELRGSEGFGYDPIFIPEGLDKTFAEMTLAEKNNLSHRARAFAKMIDFLHEKFSMNKP